MGLEVSSVFWEVPPGEGDYGVRRGPMGQGVPSKGGSGWPEQLYFRRVSLEGKH